MNIIVEGSNELISVDDSDLLEKILRVLQHQNPFSISSDRNRLLIDIDSLASQVASLPVDNPLGASEHLARSATVNFSPGFRQRFPTQVQEIRDCLKARLESEDQLNIEQYVSSLVTPLENFSGTANRLGFTYDFDRREQGLQKQKLSLERNRHSSNSLLKFHKLTIAVRNIGQFQQQLQKGLENHIDKVAQSESDREELNDILEDMVEDDLSDFHQLMHVVDTETLGKLKKEAKITYLEYLLTNIGTVYNAADAEGVIYLRDLIRRLRLIEEYISDVVERAEAHYLVNYAGISVNYKDLFSRSEVLDALPIIPIVVGNLGETTDNNRGRQFIFGLKLKLGGFVQAHGGRSSFDYHLNLLNPDSQEHQEELERNQYFPEKVLKIAFLYYFVFASRSNPESADYNPNSELEYDPIRVFEASVLPVLRGSDEEAKKHLFRKIKEGFERFKVSSKIDKLKQLLRKLLERQTTLPTRTYTRRIGVRKGILERDINNMMNRIFFNDVLLRNTREALRYISVDQQSVDGTLCQLPANITIEDIRYFNAEERQQFSMEYDIKSIRALPVLWVPKNERCNRYFQQNKLVVFLYDNRRLDPNRLNSTQAFVYRFTWVLLAYICLNILLDAQNNLFIPMVRLHLGDHQNPSPAEEFMAALSKVLSHLLKEEHLSSSQGFRIQQEPTSFRIRNGLSSLYSVLPKKFRFTDASFSPELKKLAIIVVSSGESDANRSNKNRANRIANLLGEVISVTRLEDGAVQVETLKTFSENYGLRRLYREPPVLIDQVDNLYQQGYRHFLYIAQAPYSSTLHITQTEEDEGLFFMSPTLIKALKGDRHDIKIYPVFFDKYYVRRRENLKASSFYIQDTRELTSLVKDPSKQAVMFFNLFNGITVGQDEERFYNGVISYSTLLDIYTDILDDADVYRGLIDDTPLKKELLQYITLFHFSRYEARQKINLKLDPYQNIIGDESLGSLSLFNHMNGRAEFNSLAFLTQVRKVLNVTEAGRQQ